MIALFLLLGSSFEGDVHLVDGWHVDLLAIEQLSDGEDLQPGMHTQGGSVGAAGGGLSAHGFGGFFHRDKHTKSSVLAVDDAGKIADL